MMTTILCISIVEHFRSMNTTELFGTIMHANGYNW